MNHSHIQQTHNTVSDSLDTFIRVPATQLRELITMAKQHTEDIRSGVAEGLYDPSENDDIDSQLATVRRAESLLEEGYQLANSDRAIRSVHLQELVGESVLLNAVPEFCWVAENASFTRCRNAQIGLWEFILDLHTAFTDIPPLLCMEIQTAREEGISYLLFLQKTGPAI